MTPLEQLVTRRNQTLPRLLQRLRCRDRLIQQPVEAAVGSYVRVNGRWLLNFATTNYLGLNLHPQVLKAMAYGAGQWGTGLGMPRLFATDRLTANLEIALARLVDQEKSSVFPSTTHIALDLLPMLAGANGVIVIDEWAYPISLEGAQAAIRRGAQIQRFPHNNVQALAQTLQVHANKPDKVIVCDGVYPADGKPARLHQIGRVAQAFDALVYVDDAHGIGVLGKYPTKSRPYGCDGKGTPAHLMASPGNIVHVGSMSKAFGIPIAFAAGPAGFIDYLQQTATTYTHSSPPAIPMLAAALEALRVHNSCGETFRSRLANRVHHFRHGLAKAGIRLHSKQLFPIQTLRFATPLAAETAGRELRQKGLWAVLQLQPSDYPHGGVLRFILSAAHREVDIDRAVKIISSTI